MDDLQKYCGKKILILGLGREGAASLRFFLANYPQISLGVADKTDPENLSPQIKEILSQNPAIKTHLGDNYLESLAKYDLIVKTPGIPIHIPEIEKARGEGKIISQMAIFFEQYPGTIIGITGTKGKSTTSSIIHDVLCKGGKRVTLAGNIGTPVIDFLGGAGKEDYFVCELSAHQLYDLQKSPRIAVLLNIYPEHLDYYKDFSEYIFAKANIAKFQSKADFLIYNSANREVNQIAARSEAQKIAFNEYDWHYSGKTALIGKYNLENAKIGAIVGRLLAIKDTDIDAAIAEFKPLAHRLEFVGNFDGVDFYNDSLSTIQESAVAAIESFGSGLQTLIAGGFDRHQPFDKLGQAILDSEINNLILFPSTGQRIWEETRRTAALAGKTRRLQEIMPFFTDSMEEAVRWALSHTQARRIAALSAASASFGGFRDYADRGQSYRECLTRLAKSYSDAAAVKF